VTSFVPGEADRILGALVLGGTAIAAVGPRHRGRGVGSALVTAAASGTDGVAACWPIPRRPGDGLAVPSDGWLLRRVDQRLH
jgi:GNAT superfamily N-acetyltransferase